MQVLIDQNAGLKGNFQNYDANKDQVYEKLIANMKTSHQKDIEKY